MAVGRMSEKQFTTAVKQLAHACGWRTYHTWVSIHSDPGFPDLVLCRPPRLIFAELKVATGKRGEPSAHQQAWLDGLRATGVEVYVWRSADYFSGDIATVLRAA